MRVWVKRTGMVIVIPAVCLLVASFLLYLPAVQNRVAKKAMAYVAQTTGWEIDFERINLSFPFNLSVRNAVVKGVEQDTLAYIGRLTTTMRLKPLLKGYLSVDKITLESLDLNTGHLLDGVVFKGKAGKVSLSADTVNLTTGWIELNNLILKDADIDLFVCDTIAPDTTPTGSNLFIVLQKVELYNVKFACRMPCNSVFINTRVAGAVLSDGFVDTGTERYGASGLRAQINALSYTIDEEEAAPGLDVSHIQLTDLIIASNSLYYDSKGTMAATITECSAYERSGLALQSLTGRILSDSLHLEIPDLQLTTAASTIQVQAVIPSQLSTQKNSQLSTLNSQLNKTLNSKKLSTQLKAVIHKQDALLLLGNTSKAIQEHYPDTTLTIEAYVQGDMADLTLRKLEATLPGAFNIRLSGAVKSFDNVKLRAGRVDFEVKTQTMDFVADMFPGMLQPDYQIPDSMSLTGYLTVNKGVYAAGMTGRESAGSILLSGNYDIFKKSYEAFLKIDSLEPVHFMPDKPISWLSASIHAKGQGTDPYLASTKTEIKGMISRFRYGKTSFSDIVFTGGLNNHQLQAELTSDFPSIKGRITLDGVVKKDTVKGFLIMDVDSLDLYGIGVTDTPLSSSFQLFSEFETDLAKTHTLDMTLGNWNLYLENQTVKPKMLTLAFRSNTDTTYATVYAGDMRIMLTGNTDLETVTNKLTVLSKEANVQFARDTTLNWQALRPFFPELSLHIYAERDNPVGHYLQDYNTFFENFRMDATLSPEKGLKVSSTLVALVSDTLKIDTIRLNIWQDTVAVLYNGGVVKNRFRNQEAFRLNINGYIGTREADIFASYLNGKGEKGLYLGIHGQKAPGGYDFRFYPEKPVIAFLPFTINENNYFRFINMNEMEADVQLKGDARNMIRIYSQQQNKSVHELMVELNQFNLADISRKFTAMPSLQGLLDMTFRYAPEEQSFMIIADGNIDDFYYEGGRVGELLLNATYVPLDKGTHQIDFHAFHDMAEIASLSVSYREGRNESRMKGIASVNKLPLQIFNAMIPARTVRLDGLVNGNFDITGTGEKPALSGSIKLEKVSASVIPSSTMLHFDDQPVKITNNKLVLENFKIYTSKENPLVINGYIDASNTSRPVANLRFRASEMPIIDARKTAESLVFGKMLANFNSTVTGTLQSLQMHGDMHVLGASNLTYIMKDSPLEAPDGFEGLVAFTCFADTLPRRTDVRRPFNTAQGGRGTVAVTGTEMWMNVKIDPVARLRINLDEDQSNYIDMRGGGDLSVYYTTKGDMLLKGRYTLFEGTIRYTIPIIPLTDFSIRNGSYIDWSGDPFNPYLNISAYTRVRSSVNLGGQSRMVDFNAGIQLKDDLNDVSVQFLLEAPTDATIQNQLTAMGVEERSKQAISLLMTGVYLASGGIGADNMDVGAALNSLLQREIKNIIGSLLGDVPFSFDVNTYDGTQGMGRRVDYIGRFYKDLFHERMNASFGLRYSTKDPVFGNKLFLDDLSVGYRLDMDGSREIKLFRNKEYMNLFEGEIGKVGVSYSIRRKVKRLPDLFVFRRHDAVTLKKEEDEEK